MKNLSFNQRRIIVSALVLLAALSLWSLPALAQCPLCRLAVEDSAQGKTMARGLNIGILVLLVPPVTVFCSIFFLAFKSRKQEFTGMNRMHRIKEKLLKLVF